MATQGLLTQKRIRRDMLKLTGRYIPDDMFVTELEINKENVFIPTRKKQHTKEYINAITAMLIIQHGAVEFTSLNEIKKEANEE